MGDKPLKTFDGGETPIERILRETLPEPSDRFRVENTVASGSTGRIEIVLDRALGRHLARKVLHRTLRHDRHALRAFLREAQITALLDHPSIVPVYDLGRSGNDIFFTMKLIRGLSFAESVQRRPQGAPDLATRHELARVAAKLCRVAGFAHELGWIHCDIKPRNIMLDDLGRVFLMDWGVARRLRDRATAEPLTALDVAFAAVGEHGAVGTPGFMSPEQSRNDGVLDQRSDLFMIGTVLYFGLAGRPPYVAPTVGDTLALASRCEHPPLAALAPDTPRALRRIVERAMAPDPAARYQDAEEMLEHLRQVR